nr:hypothetical protein [Tanacetum cinerariifolium]
SLSLSKRDHDVVYKVVKIRDGIRMSGADMLKEACEEHSIGKNHYIALDYARLYFDNVIS